MLTDDMIRELANISTYDNAGRHFTQWADWQPLEEAGLITIGRPVHATGIPYAADCWSLQVTPEGQDVVEAHPELHPDD